MSDFDHLRRAPEFLAPVAHLYGRRLKKYGPGPRGVYWKNAAGQRRRFAALTRIFTDADDEAGDVTVNDLGCGYGAFFDAIKDRPMMRAGRYRGYDISEEMVLAAARRVRDPRASFSQSMIATSAADYSIASGTFNMKMDTPGDEWLDYVKASLVHLWRASRRGMAFNMLDETSEAAGLPGDSLYYADAGALVRFCREHLSPDVEMTRERPLPDFTVLVRR